MQPHMSDRWMCPYCDRVNEYTEKVCPKCGRAGIGNDPKNKAEIDKNWEQWIAKNMSLYYSVPPNIPTAP